MVGKRRPGLPVTQFQEILEKAEYNQRSLQYTAEHWTRKKKCLWDCFVGMWPEEVLADSSTQTCIFSCILWVRNQLDIWSRKKNQPHDILCRKYAGRRAVEGARLGRRAPGGGQGQGGGLASVYLRWHYTLYDKTIKYNRNICSKDLLFRATQTKTNINQM